MVAAAYGLRWVWIRPEAPRKVAFLNRQDFVGTPAGLRHALSQALPPELYGSLVGTPSERASSAEAPLRGLTPEQLDQLERLTTRGTVPLRQLPRELAKPLGQHLAARSALALGRACDQFFQARPVHRSVSIQYGANPFGTKQFSFGRGNSFIGVAPE